MFYWDNSATTQVSSLAIEAMVEVMESDYGNPSSLHKMGVEAEKKVKEARNYFARSIGAKDKELYFCSGGTEANNMALLGLARGYHRKGKHIVTTEIEHPSVLKTIEKLEADGFSITTVSPDESGMITAEAVEKALQPDTIMVSVMMVNNETGTVMPTAKIGNMLKVNGRNILFHVDAVQAYGKLNIAVDKMKIDALSASGHKVHGPKGIGFCYIKEGLKCQPIVFGGGQEKNMRPGTENVPGIIGFKVAAQELGSDSDYLLKMKKIKNDFIEGLRQRGIDFQINGALETTVPYILNISIPETKSEVLLHCLESKGIFVSSGSACSSKKKAHSKVLEAMGLKEHHLDSAIRISFSKCNVEETLDEGLELFKKAVVEIQSIMNRSKQWKR